MCMGGRSAPAPVAPAPVELKAPDQIVSSPMMIQSTPAKATAAADMTIYKKKGKRALTIPQTSNINIPGA